MVFNGWTTVDRFTKLNNTVYDGIEIIFTSADLGAR